MVGKNGKSGRGGVRPGAGRPRVQPEVSLHVTKEFATRVLFRVGKKDWLTYADVSKVTSDEELALHLLANPATRHETFHRLLDRKYGKAPAAMQRVNPEKGLATGELDIMREDAEQRVIEILRRASARSAEENRSASGSKHGDAGACGTPGDNIPFCRIF